MLIQRYTKSKFGKIEKSEKGEFVYFTEHKDFLDNAVKKYCENTLYDYNNYLDSKIRMQLTIKKLKIALGITLIPIIILGLLFLQTKGFM